MNQQCEPIQELLTSYALGDLSAAKAAVVKAHLDTCGDCQAALRQIGPTLDVLRDALAAPSSAPSRLTDERRRRVFATAPGAAPAAVHAVKKQGRGIVRWITESHPGLRRAAAMLLVGCVLFAFLMTATVNFTGKSKHASINASRAGEAALRTAVDMYEVDTGHLPASLKDLANSDGSPNWHGPYVRGNVPVDPWGKPYQYTVNGDRYDVKSPSLEGEMNGGKGDGRSLGFSAKAPSKHGGVLSWFKMGEVVSDKAPAAAPAAPALEPIMPVESIPSADAPARGDVEKNAAGDETRRGKFERVDAKSGGGETADGWDKAALSGGSFTLGGSGQVAESKPAKPGGDSGAPKVPASVVDGKKQDDATFKFQSVNSGMPSVEMPAAVHKMWNPRERDVEKEETKEYSEVGAASAAAQPDMPAHAAKGWTTEALVSASPEKEEKKEDRTVTKLKTLGYNTVIVGGKRPTSAEETSLKGRSEPANDRWEAGTADALPAPASEPARQTVQLAARAKPVSPDMMRQQGSPKVKTPPPLELASVGRGRSPSGPQTPPGSVPADTDNREVAFYDGKSVKKDSPPIRWTENNLTLTYSIAGAAKADPASYGNGKSSSELVAVSPGGFDYAGDDGDKDEDRLNDNYQYFADQSPDDSKKNRSAKSIALPVVADHSEIQRQIARLPAGGSESGRKDVVLAKQEETRDLRKALDSLERIREKDGREEASARSEGTIGRLEKRLKDSEKLVANAPADDSPSAPDEADSATIAKSPVVMTGLYASLAQGARVAAGVGSGLESSAEDASESRVEMNLSGAANQAESEGLGPQSRGEAGRRKVLNSLDKSIIPEVEFRQANIRDVIAFCNEALAKESKAKGEKAPTIELDLGDEGAGGGEGSSLPAEQPTITFKARDISGLEALKIVSNVANLKYRVEGDKILVVPLNSACGPVLHRMYAVPQSVADRISAFASDRGAGAVATNAVSVSRNDEALQESPDWKEVFAEVGVNWPNGSSIKYMPLLGRLMVANTADNLETFEECLTSLTATTEESKPEAVSLSLATEEPTGPRFKAEGVNPMVTTVNQPFSTFSIDVDTASYTLSRNYMLKGQLPPAEAVRTEEFVNFFDYDYVPPINKTFGVYIDCAPSKFGHGQQLLKIGVKGRRLGREEQRGAVLTVLVDTSGSMNTPDRIELAKKSLRMLVEKLAPNDTVTLVQYDNHARVVLEPTQASNRKAILVAIDGLQCNGSTNLEEGMQKAYEMAGANFVPGAENRVLLLSDGAANLGTSSAADILSEVEAFRKQGVFCSVFGMGQGTYNDEMLEALANKGDGVYRFIDSEKEARQVFVDDLAATLNTIARDVKIQVEFNPANVKSYRQLGYENRQLKKEDFRNDAVDAGEVGSGQSVTALYELEMAPQADAGQDVVCTVRVRYMRTDVKKIEEIEESFRLSQVGRSFDGMDARFKLAACAAETAEFLRGSPFAAGSECDDVASVLRPVALELSLDTRVAELLRLASGAKDMARGE